ncbi:amino acid ABC transporter permease [Pararhizobium sp. DWP3-4]|uniref:amino acid ABC transporter permease n=1 Tax=Pararhizobium sp. DWP3-4 TaxID=2804565 RepID=UPI003CF085F7
MNYDWSWQVFFELSPDGVHTYLETILMGAGWTLALAASSFLFALTLGSILGVMRTARSRRLNLMGTIYVEIIRNIPLLVQMFLWYFVLPELLPVRLGLAMKQMPQPWSSLLPAFLCLGFYGASRVSEQVRAGIQSLPRGQLQAGTALGLSEVQVYQYIILPEAFRIIIPLMTSELVGTVKYSSVALTIGLLELTGEARSMQEFSFHIFEAFTAATLVYLTINWTIVSAMRTLERAVAVPGLVGSSGTK